MSNENYWFNEVKMCSNNNNNLCTTLRIFPICCSCHNRYQQIFYSSQCKRHRSYVMLTTSFYFEQRVCKCVKKGEKYYNSLKMYRIYYFFSFLHFHPIDISHDRKIIVARPPLPPAARLRCVIFCFFSIPCAKIGLLFFRFRFATVWIRRDFFFIILHIFYLLHLSRRE